MKPHKCRVCDGTGIVSRPPHIAGDQLTWSDNQTAPYSCKPCSGSGIVWEIEIKPSGPFHYVWPRPYGLSPPDSTITWWQRTESSSGMF